MRELIVKELKKGAKIVTDLSEIEDCDLSEFAKEVRAKIPGCFFISRGKYRSVLVGMPNYPWALSELSVGRSARAQGKTAYSVTSTQIDNNKGPANRKESVNMTAAVRNAAKYCKPESLGVVAAHYRHELQAAFRAGFSGITSDIRKARRGLFGRLEKLAIEDDIIRLWEEGAHFSSETQETVASLAKAQKERAEEVPNVPKELDAVMPVLDKNLEQTRCALVRMVANSPGELNTMFLTSQEVHPQILHNDELPERIRDAIPMLHLVEPETYVAGTGVWVNDGIFFVERP